MVALAHYAIDNGIRSYTGVAEIGWLQQILAFGWRCYLLTRVRRLAVEAQHMAGGGWRTLLQR